MKFKSMPWFMAAILSCGVSLQVSAAPGDITCNTGNPTLTAYSASYSPTAAGNNVTTMTFDVTCTRTNQGNGSATATYAVAAGNGTHVLTAPQNRAQNGANFLKYDFYTDVNCTTEWTGANTISVTTAAIATPGSTTNTITYYACIPSLQTATAPSVVYTDTVQLSITGTTSSPSVGFTANATAGTIGVNILAPVSCSITTAPGTVAFGSYTALGAAKTANTSFIANCSSGLPYTMSFDSANASGVVAGLNYTLGFNTVSGSTGTNTLTTSGTNVGQTFYINGNMPAGQAGSCAGGCGVLKTDTRTLTITY